MMIRQNPNRCESAGDLGQCEKISRSRFASRFWISFAGLALLVGTLTWQLYAQPPASPEKKEAGVTSATTKDADAAAKIASAAAKSVAPSLDPVEQALAQKISVDFQETPLQEALKQLQEKANVPIILAAKRLEEAGIPLDTPVTLSSSNISLQLAIELIVKELYLDYVDYSDRIVITTEQDAEEVEVAVLYDVRPLLHAVKLQTGEEPVIDDLIEMLTAHVDPTGWGSVSGPGPLKEFGGNIVVLQTYPMHRKIRGFLRKLAISFGVDPGAIRVTK